MKRVKAACIFQTLFFSQKEDCGLTREQQCRANREEVARYKLTMDRCRTRYQIVEETEQSDGSVLVRVRKQYNDRASGESRKRGGVFCTKVQGVEGGGLRRMPRQR